MPEEQPEPSKAEVQLASIALFNGSSAYRTSAAMDVCELSRHFVATLAGWPTQGTVDNPRVVANVLQYAKSLSSHERKILERLLAELSL